MTHERTRRVYFVVATTGVAVAAAVAVVLLANGLVYRSDSGPGPSQSPAVERAPAAHRGAPDVTPGPTAAVSAPGRSPSVVAADPVWVEDRAARTGVPLPAMRAYASGVLREQRDSPTCGLTWSTLAAIGAVETHHGTIDGRVATADGKVLPRVVGIPLDGRDVAAIPDSDGGRLDGDARWDRAVGPMQFIPQTWATWGVDGDGDGAADPDDLDDAAATAARYLCADGHDLASRQGWIDAVAGYNHHEDYVRAVAEEANRMTAS